MQFLGCPPGAAVAVFAQMFHDQTYVLKMAQARIRMPEPEALGIRPDQRRRALDQIRRRRSGRRKFVQPIGRSSHADTLLSASCCGKDGFILAARWLFTGH